MGAGRWPISIGTAAKRVRSDVGRTCVSKFRNKLFRFGREIHSFQLNKTGRLCNGAVVTTGRSLAPECVLSHVVR
jgi:hypothetical protein